MGLQLSPHFTLEELCASLEAEAHDIQNIPLDKEIIANLRAIATNVLEPIRSKWGAFSPSSGFRSVKLNSLVGGSATSAHCFGQACDIPTKQFKTTPKELAKWCVANLKSWDQIIVEPTWVHIGFKLSGNRKHVLLATPQKNGTMLYSNLKL